MKLLCVKVSYVKLFYVKFVCVVIVCERWYVGGGGEGGEGGAGDTESKTRTPHKDVGNKGLNYLAKVGVVY